MKDMKKPKKPKPTSPINQSSYETYEGYAEFLLKVGTKVVYTNEYGISFPDRIIIRVEKDHNGDAYFIRPSSSPLSPVRRENLTIQYCGNKEAAQERFTNQFHAII